MAALMFARGVNACAKPYFCSVFSPRRAHRWCGFYPEEGHGSVKREHQRDELTRSVAWLQKCLQAP